MANIEERLSLENAVKKALAKERAERGLVDEPVSNVRYIANLIINKNVHVVNETDLDTFLQFVLMYKKSFPNVPMRIYTYTELQSDQSTKAV